MVGTLYRARDTLAESRRPGGRPYDGPPMDAAALDARIAAALDELKDSDAVVQEVAPNYGQLLQQVVSVRDVFALLHPGEAFAQVTVAHQRNMDAVAARWADLAGPFRDRLGAMTPPGAAPAVDAGAQIRRVVAGICDRARACRVRGDAWDCRVLAHGRDGARGRAVWSAAVVAVRTAADRGFQRRRSALRTMAGALDEHRACAIGCQFRRVAARGGRIAGNPSVVRVW